MFATSALVSLLPLISYSLAAPHNLYLRSPSSSKKAIASLFGWSWDGVKNECASLAGAGFGFVQVSTAAEHIQGSQWWTDYQVVSYELTSKRGNRDQFKSMIDACHRAGVQVIVDVVFNHMAGIESGTGVAGHSFTHYNYPGLYQSQDFHHCGLTSNDDIQDFSNQKQVETCELTNLADLNTESDYVRQKLANHANDLLSLGVDGFRIDAAKHVAASSLSNILSRLSRKVYVTQEVVDSDGNWSNMHKNEGDVQEFRYTYAIRDAFNNGDLASISNINNRGWLASNVANVFIANHDTERGGSSLSYNANKGLYDLAHVFLLSYPYGTPTVHSGFIFSNSDQGAPNGGSCGGSSGWQCEHRVSLVSGMVSFFNQVGNAGLTNVLTTGNKAQLAYGRGSVGHVAINQGSSGWKTTFKTSVPSGTYCDVVSGSKSSGKCTGVSITVSNGSFTASVPGGKAIAIHTGAKL